MVRLFCFVLLFLFCSASFGQFIDETRDHFPRERLLKKEPYEDDLSIHFSYRMGFIAVPFGSFSYSSFLTHIAYEISPNAHIYADFGLWLPLYARINEPYLIAKEDIRQGRVDFLFPGIEFEYKPTENSVVRLSLINERDYYKAYGPFLRRRYYHPHTITP